MYELLDWLCCTVDNVFSPILLAHMNKWREKWKHVICNTGTRRWITRWWNSLLTMLQVIIAIKLCHLCCGKVYTCALNNCSLYLHSSIAPGEGNISMFVKLWVTMWTAGWITHHRFKNRQAVDCCVIRVEITTLMKDTKRRFSLQPHANEFDKD